MALNAGSGNALLEQQQLWVPGPSPLDASAGAEASGSIDSRTPRGAQPSAGCQCCTPAAAERLATLLKPGTSRRPRWGHYAAAVADLCPPPAAVAPELRSIVQRLISGTRAPPPPSSARITLAMGRGGDSGRGSKPGILVSCDKAWRSCIGLCISTHRCRMRLFFRRRTSSWCPPPAIPS